jgi:hypothetical protein
MAMPRREPITDDQLQGFKYFKKFLPLLDHLHDHATARDKAGNRTLHYDQYRRLPQKSGGRKSRTILQRKQRRYVTKTVLSGTSLDF